MALTAPAPLRVDTTRPPLVRATLDTPATRNRLDDDMLTALTGALTAAEAAEGAEVFVLDATGDSFCSGIALGEADRDAWRPRLTAVHHLLQRLADSPLVTVAVVDGAATGGGVGLAAACDHVIAGPRASFRMTEVLLGLVPAVILPVVAERTGRHRAFSLALGAQHVDAEQAAHIGLADQRTDDCRQELRLLLRRLRAADHGAVRALKRYRRELFPAPEGHAERAVRAVAERLRDPRVHERLNTFHRQGLIP
ncbi:MULTISPECIES: enoyl-CoA hydratase/isomerase family protein [unclassified Streptomyces]|uniref:enoyl-CoA hydratase/isomerase family protein n=1 Tax=unclassified Streptomyces TaxID=2593676 RepID=UPI0033ACFDCD